MKRPFLIASLLLVGLSAITVRAQQWSPDTDAIQKLEASIQPRDLAKLTGRVHKLSDYTRYYAGHTANGRRIVVGEFIASNPTNKSARIHIVAIERDLPVIFDGGCGIVHVSYDVEARKILTLICNGDA